MTHSAMSTAPSNREHKRAWQREHRRLSRESGLCPCGRKRMLLRTHCETCHQGRQRSWHVKRAKLKAAAITKYGGKCRCCELDDAAFLTIDHINNNGKTHRQQDGIVGGKIYKWLYQNNYPNEYQTLCFNCNCAKRLCEICPHQQKTTPIIISGNRAERNRQYQRRRRRQWKSLVINNYGGKCNCCGLLDIEFLTIDHKNNDGNIHRKKESIIGSAFYKWLIDHQFPSGFQALCFNCNCAKSIYGVCPHNTQQ